MRNIRAYSKADRERCLEIFDSNVPKYFSNEELHLFTSWIDRPVDGLYFVVENEGQVVACGGIYLDIVKSFAGLAWGMVDSKEHGKGYGRELTRHRIDLLLDKFKAFPKRVETSQHTEGFYQKMGFHTLKITKDGFGDGLDKVEMEMAAE